MMSIWLSGFVLLSGLVCKAETKVPCLIFSGNAEKNHLTDLAKLNRITFGDNSMVISSSTDENQQPVELLYTMYNNIVIGEEFPDNIATGIEAIDTDSGARIYVEAQSELLYLESSSNEQFTVGIFSISGTLLLTSELRSGDAVSFDVLSPGVYIAVATNGEMFLTLKFIN